MAHDHSKTWAIETKGQEWLRESHARPRRHGGESSKHHLGWASMDEPMVYFPVNGYAGNSNSDGATNPNRKRCAPGGGKGNSQRRKSGKVDIGNFTKVPHCLFGSGTAARLGKSASLLYVALCERANREGGNTFKTSDAALASETSLAPRTISGLRKKLVENGLVEVTRERGQSFSYTLLGQAFEWKQLKHRPRSKRKPRAYGALTKPSATDKGASNRIPPHANFATGYSKVC